MSGLKNSPFGKRLRASHQEPAVTTSTSATADEDSTAFSNSNASTSTTPNRAFNPIFGISSTPSLSLDSSSSTIAESGGSESPNKGSNKRQQFVGGVGMNMGAMAIV